MRLEVQGVDGMVVACPTEPPLKPNHPSTSISTPQQESTMLCGWMVWGVPSSRKRPSLAPTSEAKTNAQAPPTRWTTPELQHHTEAAQHQLSIRIDLLDESVIMHCENES